MYNNGRRPDVCVADSASPCSGLPSTINTYTEKNISHSFKLCCPDRWVRRTVRMQKLLRQGPYWWKTKRDNYIITMYYKKLSKCKYKGTELNKSRLHY
jgi:hypothetical protein